MADYTGNLRLRKGQEHEDFDVLINQNWDKIDSLFGPGGKDPWSSLHANVKDFGAKGDGSDRRHNGYSKRG